MRIELFEEAIKEGLKHPETQKIIVDNWNSIQKTVERKRAKAAIAKELLFPLPLQRTREEFEKAAEKVREKKLFLDFMKQEDVTKVLKELDIDLRDQLGFVYQNKMSEKVEEAILRGTYLPELEKFR